jgi:hypothetical protein
VPCINHKEASHLCPHLHFCNTYQQEGLDLSLFFIPAGCAAFALSLAFPFCLPLMILAIDLLLDFCDIFSQYQLTQKAHASKEGD